MAIYLVGSSEYPFRVKIHPHVIFGHTKCGCLRPIFEDTGEPGSGPVSSVVRGERALSGLCHYGDYILSPLQKTRLRVQPSTDHAGDADWELPE